MNSGTSKSGPGKAARGKRPEPKAMRATPAVAPKARKAAAAAVTPRRRPREDVAEDEVQSATGRPWEAWIDTLDRAPAAERTHGALASWLARRHPGLGPWVETLCARYWQLRDLRQPQQRADGFAASASRVVPVPIGRLYRAWAEEGERRRWFGQGGYTVTRETPRKSLRLAWNSDASSVEIYFWSKGAGSSRVQIDHAKLVSAARVAEAEDIWSQALERLEKHLGADRPRLAAPAKPVSPAASGPKVRRLHQPTKRVGKL